MVPDGGVVGDADESGDDSIPQRASVFVFQASESGGFLPRGTTPGRVPSYS